MELIALLHVLVRHRLLVALGAVAALAAGFLVTRAPSAHYGFATARVVLDTPDSQLVDAQPVGADTLPMRAALLADLMAGSSLKPKLARALGVPEQDLAVRAPHLSTPPVALPLAVRALEAAAPTTEPYVLGMQAVGPLPIIAIDARGPRKADAERLAAAATKSFRRSPAPTPRGPRSRSSSSSRSARSGRRSWAAAHATGSRRSSRRSCSRSGAPA